MKKWDNLVYFTAILIQSRSLLSEFIVLFIGRKIKPKEHSNLEMKRSKQDPEKRSKDGRLRKNKEHDSKESLSQNFLFKSYRPGSDLRTSDERLELVFWLFILMPF